MHKESLVDEWIQRLKQKPETDDFVDEVIQEPEIISVLIEIIKKDKGSVKFYCEKIVRIISERRPILVYPYFDDVASLIDSQNNFIKLGVIITLSNLISVDNENKFKSIYEKYFSLINSDSMITAGNVVKNAWKIVMKNPGWEDDITKRLLSLSANTYLNKGEPSPECKNIIFGDAIDCFNQYYEMSGNKEEIIEFVTNQRNNPRKQVAKKAESFLKRYN